MLSLKCKHVQHVKIYLPCNFEVNLIIHLGVIALFSSPGQFGDEIKKTKNSETTEPISTKLC